MPGRKLPSSVAEYIGNVGSPCSTSCSARKLIDERQRVVGEVDRCSPLNASPSVPLLLLEERNSWPLLDKMTKLWWFYLVLVCERSGRG